MINYNDSISYEIYEDGYDIFMDGEKRVTQRIPYDKPMGLPTYEENCLAQIELMTRPVDPPNNDYGVPNDVYNSIIDDYTNELIEGGII